MNRLTSSLALTAFITPSACSKGADDASASSGTLAFEKLTDSFLDDYRASLAGPAAAQQIDASGSWFGLLFCPSGLYPVTLDIDHEADRINGTAGIQAASGDARRKTPFHAKHPARSGAGSIDPKTRSLNKKRNCRNEINSQNGFDGNTRA